MFLLYFYADILNKIPSRDFSPPYPQLLVHELQAIFQHHFPLLIWTREWESQICWPHKDTSKSQGKDYLFTTWLTCSSFHGNQKTQTWNNIATAIWNHVWCLLEKAILDELPSGGLFDYVKPPGLSERDSIPCDSQTTWAGIFIMRLF